MKFEVGKYYKTRDGLKARIYSMDSTANRCIHGAILYPDGAWRSQEWHEHGRLFPIFGEDNFDLIAEWREPVKVSGWVNVYASGAINSRLNDTKAEADLVADIGKRIACVYVEGEG